ncbi:hypothetical protein [Streptomyces xanthochromogenes]|uniref:hypothetical protein n=1 Tax=Streptomyces xanthochromogenes TaxID=67384 RepID=UPI001675B56E|nr:hypothetical protein [Streptomyces xanthochromogenes]
MSTDLATLTSAADRWDGMAKEFEKRAKVYKRDVHGISMGTSWQGLTADAAHQRFDITLREFQYAQTEAKAIASLLREAHTNFAALKAKLIAARNEAIEAKMQVSDQGSVTFDYVQLSDAEKTALHHDPDSQQSIHTAVASWQDRIDHLVKAVGDADEGLATALKAVVVDANRLDGTISGFNGQALGAIEPYETAAKKADAERKAAADRKAKELAHKAGLLNALSRGINGASRGFSQPGGLGSKLMSATVEGLADATGYNNTQGISLSGSLGLGIGIGGEISLVNTRTPDGRPQLNLMYAGSTTTAGWDFGASANVGVVKSNADDISQLKGTGWDKSASLHEGIGLWGSHQNAIGTTNSKGDDVATFEGGLGLGLGTEISTGFSQADGWTLWEQKKEK